MCKNESIDKAHTFSPYYKIILRDKLMTKKAHGNRVDLEFVSWIF